MTVSWATALCAVAAITLATAGVSNAGQRQINRRGEIQLGDDRGAARRGGVDDPAGHDANDNRGAVRGGGVDDPAGHDANDDKNNNRRRGPGR